MEKATKICKICGKEYPYCKTFRDEGIFRWQDVACCQEHGSEYFAAVLAARAKQSEKVKEAVAPKKEPVKEGSMKESFYNDELDFEDEDEECDEDDWDEEDDW